MRGSGDDAYRTPWTKQLVGEDLMNCRTIMQMCRRSGALAGVLSVLLCVPGLSCAQDRSHSGVQPASAPPPLLLGAAWYPEQWPESRWNADLDLMQKAHLHLVRLGEFSWSKLEPKEGKYDLDWMERAINLAGEHGIYVVIGTPSCAPPQWLSEKYPDSLLTAEDGNRPTHGSRNSFNWDSDQYRELVREMDERLSQRFGHNPYVIAWQIDNEYFGPSFDAVTRTQFQKWLQSRYGSLDNLNRAWTTAYNNQTYFAWNEIPIEATNGNPGLMLDWRRFVSETWRSYQKNQIDAIHKYADPRQRITTNMMGWYDAYDHYTVSHDLDFAAWDDPVIPGPLGFDPIRNGAAHDLTRGFKNQNIWVMETTSGPRGGGNTSTMLDKGEMRAIMWHDIGHGADAISYWQWRDALNGQEQNHGALVDVDGLVDPIYTEVGQVGREFERAGPVLAGTTVDSQVAVLHSYESRWAINWQRMNPEYDPISELVSYYKPLHELGNSIDVVPPTDDLSKYKLVVAPGLDVLTQAAADNLVHYVQQGGHLVLGQRTGMKDENNARWPERQPGPLALLLGARVEQYMALTRPIPTSGIWGDCKDLLFAEYLNMQAPDVKVLMRYGADRGWLDGQPAAVTRKVGRGSITYIGAWLDDAGMKKASQWMLTESDVNPDLLEAPDGVEVYRRVAADRKVFIVDNLSHAAQTVVLPNVMKDVLTDQMVHSVKLPVYGVAVLVEGRDKRPEK